MIEKLNQKDVEELPLERDMRRRGPDGCGWDETHGRTFMV